ncbi:MAG: hypothetical protein A2W29_09380 [Gemmatimonadetes bacterium RBG_16_66_8]|nr:MAG: hypothetical protein A2W29_09380 [Gemmatimonadetes bacterium RBG_16_66_8]
MDAGVVMKRDGFTLIETLVALVLMGVVVLGIQGTTASMITMTTRSNAEILAMQLAEDRIDLIRMDPQYDSLAARYHGVETSIPDWPGYYRQTQLVQRRDSTANGITNWIKVTVIVSGPGIKAPFTRTVTIGAP